MKTITYKAAGVNIKKADDFVANIGGYIAKNNLSKVAAFGCPFDVTPSLSGLSHPVLVSSTDGVGTKLKIAQALGVHDTVGIDLVAMNVNDVICLGAKPLFFLDYIACGKVNPNVLGEVLGGVHRGLQESGCALLGGETAEMPGMYAQDEYDLAGFCVGIVDKDKIINGKNIKAGDTVLGLESSGLHSNGFSLVRKVLGASGIKKYGRQLLTPTRLYVAPVLNLLNAVAYSNSVIKGIAHITGGGFYKKATKILPRGYGMIIDTKSWDVPKIFNIIGDKGNLKKNEMYTVFNMGIGMMIVVASNSTQMVQAHLSHSGVRARVIGKIVASTDPMRIL